MAQSGNLLWVVAAILAALTTGTLVRLRWRHQAAPDVAASRLASLRSWWIVGGVVIAVALMGVWAACAVFAAVSLLAFLEFRRIANLGPSSGLKWLSLALIPAAYLMLGIGLASEFRLFVPVFIISTLSIVAVCEQRTSGFLNDVAKSAWGLIVTTYLLGHAVLLFALGDSSEGTSSGAGLFLLLVVLTEASDIMQALAGRRFGRHKLSPLVSPHKTWEGLLGGLASTIVLASILGPRLTAFTLQESALAGALTTVTGLFGDLNISALKRDGGVKDSGTLLPGQGGILDRVDSLTFTAPAFYYFVLILQR